MTNPAESRTNPAESRLPALEPLSSDELARAVGRLDRFPLDLTGPVAGHPTEHDPVDLHRMTAAQRFWLALTGKPGSTGRAGAGHEPGLLRTHRHSDEEPPPGIPRQPGPVD